MIKGDVDVEQTDWREASERRKKTERKKHEKQQVEAK